MTCDERCGRCSARCDVLASRGALRQRSLRNPFADFYRGKTVNMLVGVGAGGEYDLLARLLAEVSRPPYSGQSDRRPSEHDRRQRPEDAELPVRPGAARRHRDIGMVQNALHRRAGDRAARRSQFDAAKFRWLGTIAPVVETMAVWHTTGVKTIEDAQDQARSSPARTARGAITYGFPALMNELLGTKFKIVTGYNGGNQINLAMERGEVEARNNSWSSWKTTKPQWLKDKKIAVIAQAGPRAPDLDAPSIEDLARNARRAPASSSSSSRGTPVRPPVHDHAGRAGDRVAALRAAFLAVMKDPEFLAETAKLNFEVNPVSGEALESGRRAGDEHAEGPGGAARPFLE